MTQQLQNIIESAWEARATLSPATTPKEIVDAVDHVINALDKGELRVASREGVGQWTVHQWLKKAVLLSFRLKDNALISGGTLNFYDKVPTKFEVNTLLQDGIHGIEQISEIVLNLKNFSRLDREKVTDFSVEEGLNSTLLLARNLLKNKVEVRKDFGDVPQVSGSPSQVNQVFLNIITNAAQAMPERDTENIITLRTSIAPNGDMVQVEIQDNGKGIPDDVLPHIFDPFYTTKAIGEGTGMGLSISYKIIQEHGGSIQVESVKDVGTAFTIFLPLEAAPGTTPADHEEAQPASEALFAD